MESNLSVANVQASEPASQTCEPCEPNVRALRATEKHLFTVLPLPSPLSRIEKYEIQTLGVMS